MIEDIKDVFQKKKDVYRTSSDEMLGDYKREQETIGGYNGRQILELIQNCDDEEADLIHIKVDQEAETISISNTGNSFSIEGYRSLSIANLSSKSSKRTYIGNKGLGFRSIINWSNSIKIYSNNTCLEFSPNSKQTTFDELFNHEEQKEQRNKIGVKETVIPIPYLACPIVTENVSTAEFATSIEVNFKQDYYNDILKQLRAIAPETLLFLKHINEIRFEGVHGLTDLSCTKETHPEFNEGLFSPKEKITINNQSWNVFSKDDDLGFGNEDIKEQAFYELKVAVKNDLSDKRPFLFSHFPTKVRLDFPYIIHGTFDLDQNRNYLNNSPKNKFVLERLVELLIETAKFLSKKEVSWNPYKILSIKNTSDDRLRELGFYTVLSRAINTEKIFPCVDGEYRAKEDIRYSTDGLSSIIIKNNWGQKLPQFITPKGYLDIDTLKVKKGHPDLVKIIDEISSGITDIDIRAEFIKEINFNYPEVKFSLLVNEQNKLIDKNTDSYTPTQKSSRINIPSYCNIELVNEQLYNRLIYLLNLTNTTDKSREFQRKLKDNFSIHSYEPLPLTKKIISLTRKEIDESKDEKIKVAIVREMINSIYHNYTIGKDQESQLDVANIPLLNNELEIINAKDLFLSNEFKIGKKAEDLFKNVTLSRAIMASLTDLRLEDKPLDSLEEFFIWLGIKKFITHDRFTIKKETDVLTHEFCTLHDKNMVEVKFNGIKSFKSILSEIEIEQFIFLYSEDKTLKFFFDKETHQDSCRKHNYQYTSRTNQSFLSFLVHKLLFNFENYLLDESLHWLNERPVNYEHELFKKYDYSKRDVDNILIELGAKDEFEDLSIEYVTSCLERIQELNPNGKNSQLLYKKAVDHFTKNKKTLPRIVNLFANNGTEKVLLPPSEIYFSDKVKIPNQLKKAYPTLNFQLRAGGATAIEFFKINSAARLNFEIGIPVLLDEITNELSAYFNQLKAYLLVYRFDNLTKSVLKKEDASIIQRIQIHLCNDLSYKVNNINYTIEKYEFIAQSSYNYYVKVDKEDTLSDLKQNNYFSDCFSEILCHAFDSTKSKNEYRQTFRSDISDTQYLITSLNAEESLLDAYGFLGNSQFDLPLWFELSTLSGVLLNDENSIKKYLETNQSQLDPSTKYLKATDEGILLRTNIVETLFDLLNITINQFNKDTSYKVDSYTKHFRDLKKYFEKNTNKIHSALWGSLKEKPDGQHEFLDLVHKYTLFEEFIAKYSDNKRWLSEINVDECFSEFLNKNFLNLDIETTFPNINKIEEENNIFFTQEELDHISNSKRSRSLRYFSNQLENIKKEIRGIERKEETTSSTEKVSNETYELKYPSGFKVKSSIRNSTKPKKSVYLPRPSKTDADKKRIGDTSESIVYKELVKLYGEENVTLVSRLNEGLHYDIHYVLTDLELTKYVEVKTLSGNTFHLSHHEKIFGEENKENYEIWFVNGPTIIPIKDFFLNTVHHLEPQEYLVTLELEFD